MRAYVDQAKSWPPQGQAVLAQFDDETVVVYQAFIRKIAHYAVDRQRFGGGFSMDRMSWIKPGFVWMMHRSEWATAEGQERVLAIWIRRAAFDEMLARAVLSRYEAGNPLSQEEWRAAIADSEIRLQWDPDYDPRGMKLKRRALQLGLSGETLRAYAHDWIVEIQDITDYAHEQARFREQPALLLTPVEKPYPIDRETARRIGAGT